MLTRQAYQYHRTHRTKSEQIVLSDEFFIIDRPYARIALLHDADLMAPETSMVMSKMGVDLLIVHSTPRSEKLTETFWRSKTKEYLNLIVSGERQGVYLGGYMANPSWIEDEQIASMELNIEDVREKFNFYGVDVGKLIEIEEDELKN